MAGDQMALAVLVTRHHAPLLGYLYRLVGGDRQLSEDLVQETLLHVLRQRTYQAGRPFKPWLYMIATNLARDYFKSAVVRKSRRSDDEEEAYPPWRRSGVARYEQRSLSFARNIASCCCSAFIKVSTYKKSLRRCTSRWVQSNRGSRWAFTACAVC